MLYKKFGNSDLETSAIGFGGWPMGRGHYGSFDEEQVIRSIHRSMDLGRYAVRYGGGLWLGRGGKAAQSRHSRQKETR